MQTAEIYEKLTELFRELFADDLIVLTPQTTANDIEGWDSFNHISVIVAVETRFGVKMSTGEIENLANVGALVTAIQTKLPDSSAAGQSRSTGRWCSGVSKSTQRGHQPRTQKDVVLGLDRLPLPVPRTTRELFQLLALSRPGDLSALLDRLDLSGVISHQVYQLVHGRAP